MMAGWKKKNGLRLLVGGIVGLFALRIVRNAIGGVQTKNKSEQTRKTSERTRKTSEQTRKTSARTRKTSQQTRKTSEPTRKTSKQTRKTSEQTWEHVENETKTSPTEMSMDIRGNVVVFRGYVDGYRKHMTAFTASDVRRHYIQVKSMLLYNEDHAAGFIIHNETVEFVTIAFRDKGARAAQYMQNQLARIAYAWICLADETIADFKRKVLVQHDFREENETVQIVPGVVITCVVINLRQGHMFPHVLHLHTSLNQHYGMINPFGSSSTLKLMGQSPAPQFLTDQRNEMYKMIFLLGFHAKVGINTAIKLYFEHSFLFEPFLLQTIFEYTTEQTTSMGQ